MQQRDDRRTLPPQPAGRLQQALALQRAGRLAEAERVYRQIVAAEPGNAHARVLRAQVTAQLGQVERGLAMLEEAVRAWPDFVPALNGLAALSLQLRRLPAAEAAARRALARAPHNAVAHFNWGQIQDAAGRPADAADSYRRALELSPRLAAARLPLAVALHRAGRLDEAAAAYERVPADDPGGFTARFNLGMLHEARREWGAAAACHRAAAEIRPEEAAPQLQLGNVYAAMGRPDDAVRTFRRLLARHPAMVEAYGNLAKALWAAGDAEAALAACDHGLRRRSGDTAILAFKAVLLQETGDGAGARALVDFDRFLRLARIDPPPGFADLAEFNAALARFALGHPTLVQDPRHNATRDGKHTADLLMGGPKGSFALLEQAIEDAVRRYLQDLAPDPAHPFTAGRPARWKLSAWAVVMDGQGYQIPHIHPMAWLSGVYYASVPPSIAAGSDHAGWIEFGEPLPEYRCKAPPVLRLIRPEEGAMLLFPSYFHHRTLPFRAAEARVSFAFDVVPVSEDAPTS
jgi:uncharacterized protein (TIGR02466 family)